MSGGTIAGVILAAGGARRMGMLKQLLAYQGRSLLMHAVETVREAGCGPVVVVVGYEGERLRQVIDEAAWQELGPAGRGGVMGESVHVVENAAWAAGLGGSISRGVAAAEERGAAIEAIVLMLCDQPLVTADLLRRMTEVYREGKHAIVACDYGDAIGPPALFDRRFFAELKELKGSAGARGVIEAHREQVALVRFPEGRVDIDTPGDYTRLNGETAEE